MQFEYRPLSYWIAELPRLEKVPGGLFDSFPRATRLFKLGLRHPAACVRLETLVFLQKFDDGFGLRTVNKRNERGFPCEWSIDEREYPAFAAAVGELVPDILSLLVNSESLRDVLPPEVLSSVEDDLVQIPTVAAAVLQRFGEAAAPAVPTLISWLGEAGRHELASYVLRSIGEKAAAAAPRLMELIEDPSFSLHARMDAVELLGRVKTDERRAVDLLVRLLKTGDPGLRSTAAEALWYLNSRAASAATALTSATRDTDACVRARAIEALARVNPRGDVALPVVAAALEDSVQEVRQSAMIALLDLRQCAIEVIPIFRRVFRSRDDDLRRQALRGMACAAADCQHNELRAELAKEFRAVLRGGYPELRETALTGLANLRCDQNECVKLFQAAATNGPADERSKALIGLANSGSTDPETLEAYKLACSAPDANVREGAVYGLGAFVEDRSARELLHRALSDTESRIRFHAAETLLKGESHCPNEPEVLQAAESVLRAFAAGTECNWRALAAGFLLAMEPSSTEYRGVLLEELNGPSTRRGAIHGFRRAGILDSGIEAALERILPDKDDGFDAAMALTELGSRSEACVPILGAGLDMSHTRLRRMACRHLAYLGSLARPVLGRLEKCLTDSDSETRLWAAVAIAGVGGDGLHLQSILLSGLATGDSMTRACILGALACRPPAGDDALAALVEATNDGNEHCRGMAVVALSGMCGHAETIRPIIEATQKDSSEVVRQLGAQALERFARDR
ncbi:MAG: hypothetical protein CMJ48_02980 [Planctomycetaceae bacterium]|nr:hypothetical protein [Planctomycetaceae bacterium]